METHLPVFAILFKMSGLKKPSRPISRFVKRVELDRLELTNEGTLKYMNPRDVRYRPGLIPKFKKLKQSLQKSIDAEFTKLINAFGGVDAFDNYPVLDVGCDIGPTDYIDYINPSVVKAPIMTGVDALKRRFLVLKLVDEQGRIGVCVLFHRHHDRLGWVQASSHFSRGRTLRFPHNGNNNLEFNDAFQLIVTRILNGETIDGVKLSE